MRRGKGRKPRPVSLPASALTALLDWLRGRKAGIQPLAPHDLRRTWTGDPLQASMDLATVQKMAGHELVTTTGKYDRRNDVVRRKAPAQLHVPYVAPEE